MAEHLNFTISKCLTMHISLNEKQAVICGSTQGIGLAIARQFAASGATCILVARDEKKLTDAVQSLSVINGQRHDYRVADFADPTAVKKAIETVTNSSTVHILVNNTGGPKPGEITEANPALFTEAFQQHIVNNQNLVQAVLPGMKQAEYGRIINVVSTSVRIPIPFLGVSNTIRAAVAGWAKTLSNEVARYNITVNNILPGLIQTQRLTAVTQMTMQQQHITQAEAEETLLATIPMHRFGQPAELGFLATFLASPQGAYITGTSIAVDGGRTASL